MLEIECGVGGGGGGRGRGEWGRLCCIFAWEGLATLRHNILRVGGEQGL